MVLNWILIWLFDEICFLHSNYILQFYCIPCFLVLRLLSIRYQIYLKSYFLDLNLRLLLVSYHEKLWFKEERNHERVFFWFYSRILISFLNYLLFFCFPPLELPLFCLNFIEVGLLTLFCLKSLHECSNYWYSPFEFYSYFAYVKK